MACVNPMPLVQLNDAAPYARCPVTQQDDDGPEMLFAAIAPCPAFCVFTIFTPSSTSSPPRVLIRMPLLPDVQIARVKDLNAGHAERVGRKNQCGREVDCPTIDVDAVIPNQLRSAVGTCIWM
jgi:hypothetical protein